MQFVDSILFDLDGTLWDGLDTCIGAWNQVLGLRDERVTKSQLRSVMGLEQDEIANKLIRPLTNFKNLTNSEVNELMEEIYSHEIAAIRKKGGRLYKNTKSVLGKLKRNEYLLFIVSNCQKGYIEAFLSFYHLDSFFTDHVSSGDTGKGKAENIKSILKKHSLSSPVYIGDTLEDFLACEKINIPFIYAKYGFGGKKVKSKHQISDISELLDPKIFLRLEKENSCSNHI